MKTKTIGPMTRYFGGWKVQPFGASLCGDALGRRFDIPRVATKLWVTLTKHRPKHPDAIHVVFPGGWCSGGRVRFDGQRRGATYIRYRMCDEAQDFGSDFYATIIYSE